MKVLFHDPRPNAEVQSSPAKLALIPPHKSLWTQPVARPADRQPVEPVLRERPAERARPAREARAARPALRALRRRLRTARRSPQWLNYCRAEIEAFLPARLGLQLNPRKTVLQPIAAASTSSARW
jgi:RNA-directed DNA polymerase